MTARTRSAWRDDYHATMNRLHRYMVPTQDGARRIPHHPSLVPLTNRLDRLELEGLEHGWLTIAVLTTLTACEHPDVLTASIPQPELGEI